MDVNKSIRVLIIEDEKLISWSLKHTFEKMGGYSVDCAYTGSDALQQLNDNQFDIVITDLNLPDVDDLKIVKKIKEKAADTPVIVMSANLTDSYCDDVMTQGACNCINKPFEINDVLGKVKEAVRYHIERNI